MKKACKTKNGSQMLTEDDSSSIGERIKYLRGPQSQRDFAIIVDINKSSLGRYERGESYPDAVDLQKLCVKLNVAPDWLLFGGERQIYQKKSKKKLLKAGNSLLTRRLAEESMARHEQELEIKKLATVVAELQEKVSLLSDTIQPR